MAELPQSFVPGTSSGKDAGDDGEVAGPAYYQPESYDVGPTRDRSSSLTGEPLHIRRGIRRSRSTSRGVDGNTEGEQIDNGDSDDTEQFRDPISAFTDKTPHKRRRSSSVSRGPNSDCCRPKNPFELAPEQLAQRLCSSPIFEQSSHETPESFPWSIEQLSELFPASVDEEELVNPDPGGTDDPHEQARHTVDRFFSTREIVLSPSRHPPVVIVVSPSNSSESNDDGDNHPSEEELQVSSDASEEILAVPLDVDRSLVSQDRTALDGARDKNSGRREKASRGRVRRRLFCSGVGKAEETAADDSRLMGDALEGRSPTPSYMPLHSSPICKGDPMLPSWNHASDAEDSV